MHNVFSSAIVIDDGDVRTVPNCSELPPEQKFSELVPAGNTSEHVFSSEIVIRDR